MGCGIRPPADEQPNMLARIRSINLPVGLVLCVIPVGFWEGHTSPAILYIRTRVWALAAPRLSRCSPRTQGSAACLPRSEHRSANYATARVDRNRHGSLCSHAAMPRRQRAASARSRQSRGAKAAGAPHRSQGCVSLKMSSVSFAQLACSRCVANTNGYSSTYLAMGFAHVRAGTRYPPEH